MVVGAAVGGVLGAALLVSLGALAFMIKKRRDDQMAYQPATSSVMPASSTVVYSPGYLQQYSKPVQYPDGSYVPPQELPERSRHEMQ